MFYTADKAWVGCSSQEHSQVSSWSPRTPITGREFFPCYYENNSAGCAA